MEKSTKKFIFFPKIKKKISDFIRNEDGNISTKAAIIVGATGLATLGVSEALGYCEKQGGHFSGNVNGHYNGTGTFGATLGNPPGVGHCSVNSSQRHRDYSGHTNYASYHTNYGFYNGACTGGLSCNTISGNASGHYNIVPTCTNGTAVTAHCNHDNSGSGTGDSGSGDS